VTLAQESGTRNFRKFLHSVSIISVQVFLVPETCTEYNAALFGALFW